jgi:predicted DNA-binding transcriptional regulator YafY
MGFEVDKDPHHKFFLRSEAISEPFTKEESQLIHEALSVAAKNNPLAASIQAKLPYLAESQTRANQVMAVHIAKLVSQIQEAIKNDKQVRILKYQSASSESISDRLIEPIGFTDNYQTLCAFEVESQQNKYFKLERMGGLEIIEENAKFKELHQLLKPDVFGFNETGKRFHIQLKLSMRAMLFLKDDYPATTDFLTEQKDGTWLLDVEVNNMEPVERIMRGMPIEVESN